jgi:hypothetical protein
MYEVSRSIRTFSYLRYEGSAQLVHRLDKARTAWL